MIGPQKGFSDMDFVDAMEKSLSKILSLRR